MTRAIIIDAFIQDLSFAVRTLRRQKAFASVAVLTLGLGIGATTAVFSVVSSLLLHPIDYPHSDRIAVIFREPTAGKATAGFTVMVSTAPSTFQAWRSQARDFEDIESYATSDMVLHRDGAPPLPVHAARVLPSFARFAGARPLAGRELADFDVTNGSNVVLLGEGLWHTQFGGDAAIVGKTIAVDDKSYTVAGVMPASLRLPRLRGGETDLWLPLDLRSDAAFLSGVGRLRPNVTMAAASAELDSISIRTAVQHPDPTARRFHVKLVPPGQLVNFRQSLLLLIGAAGLVLLIACANVAHLLIARAATRQRELAIRSALGAGRARIFRQLVTESVLLTTGGVGAGLAIGWVGLKLLLSYRPDSLSELTAARLDATTLGLTIAIGALTGLLFGVIGAFRSDHRSTSDVIKGNAQPARARMRGRSTLIVSEMALSLILLVGAGLLIRSIVHLQTMTVGFDPSGLYVMELPMGRSDAEASARAPRVAYALRQVGAMAGVGGVTLATASVPGFSFTIGSLQIEGMPVPPKGETSLIPFNDVASNYFQVMRQRLVDGRTFIDTSTTSKEIIVNEGFARKYWPARNAVGHRIRVVHTDGTGQWSTIVGVVADAFTGGLTSEASAPTLFMPTLTYSQYLHPNLIVRVTDIRALPGLRAVASAFDPGGPPPTMRDVGQAMAKSAAGPRFTMLLLSLFTACAMILTAVGVYGVMSYSVVQRTREIGIRLALGASANAVGGNVLGHALLLAVIGIAIGLAGAAWTTKFIEGMLYGVPRLDAASYGGAIAVLLAVSIVACLVPVRRAVGVDPVIAMRVE